MFVVVRDPLWLLQEAFKGNNWLNFIIIFFNGGGDYYESLLYIYIFMLLGLASFRLLAIVGDRSLTIANNHPNNWS